MRPKLPGEPARVQPSRKNPATWEEVQVQVGNWVTHGSAGSAVTAVLPGVASGRDLRPRPGGDTVDTWKYLPASADEADDDTSPEGQAARSDRAKTRWYEKLNDYGDDGRVVARRLRGTGLPAARRAPRTRAAAGRAPRSSSRPSPCAMASASPSHSASACS